MAVIVLQSINPSWHSDAICRHGSRAPSQYPKRRLFVRSRKVSKPRDWYFKLPYRFEIWQAHRQHWEIKIQISRLRDFTRSYGKTSFRILRRGPGRNCFTYICNGFLPGGTDPIPESMKPCRIHMRAISLENAKLSIVDMQFENYLGLQLYLSGPHELNQGMPSNC